MKKLVLILFLAFGFVNAQTYVAVNGKATNKGTLASPISIDHAFKTAKAGSIYYIKAGNYGSRNLVLSVSGTKERPIKFIGYKLKPGDLNAKGGTTIGFGKTVDPSRMPLIQEKTVNGVGKGKGIDLRSCKYIHLRNFQIKGYRTGLESRGANCLIDNVVSQDAGNHNVKFSKDWQGTNGFYQGWGMVLGGDNLKAYNNYVLNAGAEGIKVLKTVNADFQNNGVCATRGSGSHGKPVGGNPTDYYFLVSSDVRNSSFKNTKIYRKPGLAHFGHGIVQKSSNKANGPSTGNVFDGFEIYNTYLEFNFPNTKNFTAMNGLIKADPKEKSGRVGIRVVNGAEKGTFKNIKLERANIRFSDWKDGLPGDVNDAGDDCVWENITIDGQGIKAAIMFDQFGANTLGTGSSADNHTFKNLIVKNTKFLFIANRKNSNIKFIDSHFEGIGGLKTNNGVKEFPIDASYTGSNFYKVGFTRPKGTTANPYKEKPEPVKAAPKVAPKAVAVEAPKKGASVSIKGNVVIVKDAVLNIGGKPTKVDLEIKIIE